MIYIYIYTRVEGPPRRAHHFEDVYDKNFHLSFQYPIDPAYLISGFLLVVLHSRWRPRDLIIPPCIYLGPAISRTLMRARSPFVIPAAHLP